MGMAPHYARPAAPVPLQFDTAGAATPAAGTALTLPDWRGVFLDPRLRQVIALGLDLAQIQSSAEAARVDVARDATQLAQARDALQLVVGAPVDAALLAGTDAFDGSVALAPVPAHLEAAVLLQRPDVLAAEHGLKAANTDIGAARAAFFPTVSLYPLHEPHIPSE